MTCPKCGGNVEVKEVTDAKRSVTSKVTFACTNLLCDYRITGDF